MVAKTSDKVIRLYKTKMSKTKLDEQMEELVKRFQAIRIYGRHPLDGFEYVFFAYDRAYNRNVWLGDSKFKDVTFQEVKDRFSEVQISFIRALLNTLTCEVEMLGKFDIQTSLAVDFLWDNFFSYYGIDSSSFSGDQHMWADQMTQRGSGARGRLDGGLGA